MTSEDLNGLICFTNCLLPQEDGSMANKDLWVDVRRGVILDAQVRAKLMRSKNGELMGIPRREHFLCASRGLRRSLISKGIF